MQEKHFMHNKLSLLIEYWKLLNTLIMQSKPCKIQWLPISGNDFSYIKSHPVDSSARLNSSSR